jgi:hypothetical protein
MHIPTEYKYINNDSSLFYIDYVTGLLCPFTAHAQLITLRCHMAQ